MRTRNGSRWKGSKDAPFMKPEDVLQDIAKGNPTMVAAIKDLLKTVAYSLPRVDPRSGTILVINGNGVVGSRVAHMLLDTGYPTVRVGSPKPETLRHLEVQGAQLVEFDWEKEHTYEMALAGGVKSVFISFPHHPNWKEQFPKFLDACKKAGVQHYVKLSFYHSLATEADTMGNFVTATRKTDPFLKVPLVLMHREFDAKLMKLPQSCTYCILFASHFMSNPMVYQADMIRKEHCFEGASAGKPVNYVSPNDVAEVAVRALLAPKDHARVGYNLTGPVAVTDNQVAKLLGDKLGTSVQYVDAPLEQFAKNMAHDTDWGPASDATSLEYVKSTGVEIDAISKDVEKVCGRRAQAFDEYMEDQDKMTPLELEYLRPF